MARFCIVGCGLTAAITASLLKQKLPQLQVIILEKSRGTGGRFCTARSSFGSTVDLGAQFVTKSKSLSEIQKKCYSELLDSGLLQPLQEEIDGLKKGSPADQNFICPQGSGSVVKHFLQTAGCEILFGNRVIKLSSNGEKWKLFCENNLDYEFDGVILTMPVPQILQIEGIFSYLKGEQLENLKSVTYSSRFALGLFYDYNTSYFDELPWVAKFLVNQDILRFCSLDHKKRKDSTSFPSIAVHTTKEYGGKHIDDDDTSAIQKNVLNSLENVLPKYPNASNIKFQKWRYSQVEKSYINKPGSIIVSKTPLLIAGGDGFSYSTFEGCILSSESIVKNVIENCLFKKKQ